MANQYRVMEIVERTIVPSDGYLTSISVPIRTIIRQDNNFTTVNCAVSPFDSLGNTLFPEQGPVKLRVPLIPWQSL